jgi:hypothetical protein
LFGVTIRRHIEELSENVFTTLKSKSKNLVFYSIALDESVCATDIANYPF